MIFQKAIVSLAAVLLGLSLTAEVRAADLTEDYLLGTWILDDTDCADPASEFVIFRDNGAVESVRAGELEAAGFWVLSGDIIEAHLVASPAFFHDARADFLQLTSFEGEFYAFGIRVVPLNMENDKFDAVGLLGEEVSRSVFQRCKS